MGSMDGTTPSTDGRRPCGPVPASCAPFGLCSVLAVSQDAKQPAATVSETEGHNGSSSSRSVFAPPLPSYWGRRSRDRIADNPSQQQKVNENSGCLVPPHFARSGFSSDPSSMEAPRVIRQTTGGSIRRGTSAAQVLRRIKHLCACRQIFRPLTVIVGCKTAGRPSKAVHWRCVQQ